MAGWSVSKDGSALDSVQTCKINWVSFDFDSWVQEIVVDGCADRLRSWFDQVLWVFWSEVSGKKCVPPVPALLGDGQSVDLFNLFWVVRRRGGFEAVSESGWWASVAEECGLDIGAVASIKLIYLKYLDGLDQWLRRFFTDGSLGNGESEVIRKLELLFLELQREFRGKSFDTRPRLKHNSSKVKYEFNKNDEFTNLDDRNCEMHFFAAGNVKEVSHNAERIVDDEKFCVNDNNDFMILDTSVRKRKSNAWKRKRESLSLSGMLNWVIGVAKHSDDPTIGGIPECSNWNEHGREEFWVQALLAREALLIRRWANSNTEEPLLQNVSFHGMNCQKKLKMHPSMYDDSDVPNHRSVEGLRCSKRLPSLIKAQLCPCCNSCSSPCKMLNPCELEVDHGSLTHKLEIPHKGNLENDPNDQACSSIEILDRDTIDGMFGDKSIEKQVSEGPLFQAEVPEWTGVASESDSKWLGMPTWAPKVVKGSCMIQMDPIGKGRQDLCGCRCPGSVDCVRFHIAEKRMKLKLELDLAFYHWRFDCMGEEVSLSWTVEEENRFKTMVQSNAPFPNKSFWDVSSKFFPTKTKEKLVSYYFNVFLIRRRSYQNRVIPKNIDSDDDEMEFGCVGDGFGYEAVRIPGSKLLLCTQNEQCTELE